MLGGPLTPGCSLGPGRGLALGGSSSAPLSSAQCFPGSLPPSRPSSQPGQGLCQPPAAGLWGCGAAGLRAVGGPGVRLRPARGHRAKKEQGNQGSWPWSEALLRLPAPTPCSKATKARDPSEPFLFAKPDTRSQERGQSCLQPSSWPRSYGDR